MKSKLPALPYLIWMLLFILVPLGLVVFFAFTTGDGSFTLDNIFGVGQYTAVLIKSLWLAALSTVICLAVGYPVAYMISRTGPSRQRLMILLIMLPMWMNFCCAPTPG